jgi:hypothetical protein
VCDHCRVVIRRCEVERGDIEETQVARASVICLHRNCADAQNRASCFDRELESDEDELLEEAYSDQPSARPRSHVLPNIPVEPLRGDMKFKAGKPGRGNQHRARKRAEKAGVNCVLSKSSWRPQ